jgi:hypothetical protein
MSEAPLNVAPWNKDQVEALNGWQKSAKFHPFTCANRGDGNHPFEHEYGDIGVLRQGGAMRQPQFGDVVQLHIVQNWAHGLLMVVEEVRAWGVTGMVPTPSGDAPMRAKFEEITTIWRRVPDA